MALRIETAEAASAVTLVHDIHGNPCAGGFGQRVHNIGVVHHEINAVGVGVADIGRLLHHPTVLVIIHGAEHDHAVAVSELGVGDGAVGVRVDGVLFEAESGA